MRKLILTRPRGTFMQMRAAPLGFGSASVPVCVCVYVCASMCVRVCVLDRNLVFFARGWVDGFAEVVGCPVVVDIDRTLTHAHTRIHTRIHTHAQENGESEFN